MSRLRSFYSGRAVVLAPMEDITDAVYRRNCRGLGADLCFTEFVNVDSLLKGEQSNARKMRLTPDDQPTAIQIYGSDPKNLMEAAALAEAAGATFIDINCGCWIPRIAARGAGAGWLRDPQKMVAMAEQVVKAVGLPVSVKTRIGYGPESEMPIVDLARRLEDVGVEALTIHCRTAKQRHDGAADWTWAAKAQAVTQMPVIVNGDVRTAEDAERAIRETKSAGVMVGRAAIDYPWVFREARALLDRGERLAPPTPEERIDFLLQTLRANVEERGERLGVFCTRRHYAGVLKPIPGGPETKAKLYETTGLKNCEAVLEALKEAQHQRAA